MKTVHAVWELENIGTDTWEIILDENDAPSLLAEEDKRLISLGARYLVVKTPVACPALLFELPKLGYAYVETVFHVMMRRSRYHMPEDVARFDRGLSVRTVLTEPDRARVFNCIRRGVFVTDRVSIDPAFSVELGANRYINWLRSMLEQDAKLYEVLSGDKPIGFFVIQRKDERTVDPVLMGMYDERGDRGLGTLLHKKTLDTCFEWDCDRMTSTVVSNNQKVLRVYINAGASVTDMLYTYVKHIG